MTELFKLLLDYLANSGVGISLIISLITLAIYGHLIFVQSIETVSFKDFLRKYRIFILTFLVISFLSIIPVTYYLFSRYTGVNDENLRNLATITARIGPLAQAVAFEIIFFYRRKEK